PISGEVFWYISNGVSKPFFAALLALFAREAGAGRDRIIGLGLDSAGWHTAPNLAVPDGIRLAYLPPYSPELQPAEHLWLMTVSEISCVGSGGCSCSGHGSCKALAEEDGELSLGHTPLTGRH